MKCLFCPTEFTPKRSTAKFCSVKCKTYHGRGLVYKPNLLAKKATETPQDAPRPVSAPVTVPKVEKPASAPAIKPTQAAPQIHLPDPPQPRPVVVAKPASPFASIFSRLPTSNAIDLSRPQAKP